MSPKEVEDLVLAAIPGARVTAQDTTGTGDHFEVVVVSEAFAGKPLVEQHRMVFTALEGEMDRRIHAVSLKTRVPG